MYSIRVEGLSGELDYLVMYHIVMCDDETSVSACESVTHRKVLQATVTFILKVGGFDVITRT